MITLGFGNNLKNIVVERNHISELYNFYNIKDFIVKNIIRNLMKLIYGQFDAIVGNSKELSKDLNKYISLKVLTIQNPLPQHQLKTKLFKKEKGRILNIGRLEKQKSSRGNRWRKLLPYSKSRNLYTWRQCAFGLNRCHDCHTCKSCWS